MVKAAAYRLELTHAGWAVVSFTRRVPVKRVEQVRCGLQPFQRRFAQADVAVRERCLASVHHANRQVFRNALFVGVRAKSEREIN